MIKYYLLEVKVIVFSFIIICSMHAVYSKDLKMIFNRKTKSAEV